VQLAKAFGAEVTAVCSPRNVEMVRSIGADQVIDYTKEDATRQGQRYDLILAVNGYHSIFAYRRALHPTGRYVFVGASKAHLFRAVFQAILLGPVLSRTGSQHMGSMWIAKITQQDLVVVKELLEAGKVVPVIDRQYPLSETAEAFRYLEEEHAQGKVVITVGQNNPAS
jgi:NADPH:quinone reductase-like Zn-dependent oxidoreductase